MSTEEDELTPVDDVRRVREQLDREVNGDISELIKRADQVAREYTEKLGLKWVPTPSQAPRPSKAV